MAAATNSGIINHQVTATIAGLSKVKSNPGEDFLNKYTGELNGILDYVTQIQTQNTGAILPTDIMQTISISQLREDEPPKDAQKYNRTRSNILAGFPARKGDLLELPIRIIE